MALTPEIRAPQGYVMTAVRISAHQVNAPQGYSIAAVNFPTTEMRAAQGYVTAGIRGIVALEVAQAYTIFAARGRTANPRVRAWTFSLDGHDFYVIRLGDKSTLVYDVYSEQWMEWADFDANYWRANNGQNWVGGTRFGPEFGSDVVVGDDTWGVLYFLDPDQPFDMHPDYLNPNQEIYFNRIVMGQFNIKGREVMPCYSVWLTTDMGNPAYDGASVKLSISDDAGKTFDDMGSVVVTMGLNKPELSWYSLGQIGAPGRLFKIVDDGAIVRIDGMEMNDPDDDR